MLYLTFLLLDAVLQAVALFILCKAAAAPVAMPARDAWKAAGLMGLSLVCLALAKLVA